MKKSAALCLLLICCSCIAFTGGFYVGRSFGSPPVLVEKAPMGTESDLQKVNINTATLEQLMTLPHIGPALAQEILDYRQSHGPFENIGDIANVPGIGGTILEDVLAQITVGG